MNQLNALSDAGESQFVLMVFPLHLAGVFLDFSFIYVRLFVCFFPQTEGPTRAAFKSNTSKLESRIKQETASEVYISIFFKVKLAVQK